jgi:hypothetical protein
MVERIVELGCLEGNVQNEEEAEGEEDNRAVEHAGVNPGTPL